MTEPTGSPHNEDPPREKGAPADDLTRTFVTPPDTYPGSGGASGSGSRGGAENASTAGLSGCRIGRYRMLTPIGAGGMGEVWLAEDSTLGRKAAIKLLPPEFTASAARLRRFEREARAASALNHPNIITIYETGSDDAPFGRAYFLAAEYIEGVTVRQRLDSGRLEIDLALDVALQAAAALKAAHAAGLVHRDIKPENIMIRPDGLVKVLDFGLAKLAAELDDPAEKGEDDEPTSLTVTGLVMGTPRYMSPEQAGGLKVDARTDIFSLGVVLYEMLAGQPPFDGATKREVFQAVVGREAVPVSQRRPDASQGLDAILQRALTKDRDRRYQTVREFSEELERERQAMAKARPAGWNRRTRAAIAAAALAVMGAAAYKSMPFGSGLFFPNSRSDVPPVTVPFTSFVGAKDFPAFSPDGNRIAFAWDGGNSDRSGRRNIYVKPIGAGEPGKLTSAPEDDILPAWSPDGQSIAFLRILKSGPAVFVVPVKGGPEKEITAASSGVSWSPDGKTLAICSVIGKEDSGSVVLLRLDSGERRRLTEAKPPIRDREPAFSPDGKSIVFLRSLSTSARDLYVVPAAGGEARRLTFDNRPIFGAAWTADSREIVFAVNRGGGRALWRIPASGGKPERIGVTGQNPLSPAISRQGNRLAYTDTYSDSNLYLYDGEGFNGRPVPGKFGAPAIFASSTREDTSPQFSPDGERVVFSSQRDGSEQIWVCRRDGSGLMQLTRFDGPASGTPRWSPDGQSIALDSRAQGSPDIYVIPATGGEPRRLTGMPYSETTPSWSHDGRWLYFTSDRSGRNETWKMPVSGGDAIQLTHTGAMEGYESPDAKLFYFSKDRGVYGIWSVPVNGGEEKLEPELATAGFWRSWGVMDQGLYFITKEQGIRPTIRFFSFATRRVTPLLTVDKEALWFEPGLTISTDGRHLIYAQVDHAFNDILLMDHFR